MVKKDIKEVTDIPVAVCGVASSTAILNLKPMTDW